MKSAGPSFRTRKGPVFMRQLLYLNLWGQFNGFHHLSEHSVSKDDNGSSVFISQIKGFIGQIGKLLAGVRGQDDRAIIPVSSSSCSLEIIRLGRSNVAQARASPAHVDDNCRQLQSCEKRNTFL